MQEGHLPRSKSADQLFHEYVADLKAPEMPTMGDVEGAGLGMATGIAIGQAMGALGETGEMAMQAYDLIMNQSFGRPAARLMDLTEHGKPLSPGPGSFNVFIGYMPAWRGIPNPGAADALISAATVSNVAIAAATAATQAAITSGNPGAAALDAAEQALKEAAKASLEALIAELGIADQHICPVLTPAPPHGMGVVVDGSPKVMINYLPACRMGDSVLEPLGGLDKIVTGWPTVLIGGGGGDAAERFGKAAGNPVADANMKMLVDGDSQSLSTSSFDGVQDILDSAQSDYDKTVSLIDLAQSHRDIAQALKWLEQARRQSQEWSSSLPLTWAHYNLKGQEAGQSGWLLNNIGQALFAVYNAAKYWELDDDWQSFNRWFEEMERKIDPSLKKQDLPKLKPTEYNAYLEAWFMAGTKGRMPQRY